MKHALRSRPSGFTMLEMAIAATIALMIFMVGFYSITTSQRFQTQTSHSLRQSENARIFFDMLERDLRSAYPAWHITKKEDLVKINMPSAKTDALEFIARLDHSNAAPDAIFIVRYFVIAKNSGGKAINQLRREVLAGYLAGTPAVLDVTSIPVMTSSAVLDDSTSTVFDEVDKVQFNFRIYHPETKTFEPSITDLPPGQVPQATHLLVRLFLKDDGRGNQKESGVVLPRMYQKAIPLPGGFTQ